MVEMIKNQSIFIQYLTWHFFDVPKNILKAWRNFLLFNLNYFSIPLLLKTLFSHWHRYRYSYGKRFDLRRYFEAFTFNMISRVLGTVVRIIFIFIGLIAEFFIILAGIIIFFGWFILPLFLLFGLYHGFKILL